MRHFYKAIVGPPDVPLITEIMRRQNELFDENGVAKDLPESAKMLSLGIMQITNALGLVNRVLRRIDHNGKDVWSAEEGVDHYVKVLCGQIVCMIGDEAPALNTGEWWWLDAKQDAIVINKSGEDAILLYVTTKVA